MVSCSSTRRTRTRLHRTTDTATHRTSEERADDLDAQFEAIVDGLRRDVRRLRQEVERYGRAYQERAEAQTRSLESSARAPLEPDDPMPRAHRRLKQLQLAVAHIESSAAYLLGSGLEPAAGHDEIREVAQRVLESLEAERERLYRDVHDGPAQVLANAIFDVEYLERMIERAPVELRGSLRAELVNLKSHFRESLESVRGMIYDLRPPILTDLGLGGAIRNYATEFEARYGLAVAMGLDDAETGLLPEQELAIYRVMQEALQNTHKHGNASTVRITWERTPSRWRLECGDDGVGFDLVKAARRRKSVGLLSMRERAELIGGSLQIRSAPGEGTTVTLLLPVTNVGDTVA